MEFKSIKIVIQKQVKNKFQQRFFADNTITRESQIKNKK